MKKITKENFSNLKNCFEVVCDNALDRVYAGEGSQYSTDCVINCFTYYNPSVSAEQYNYDLQYKYGYSLETAGGVRTCDIAGVGACENITVQEITNQPLPLGAKAPTVMATYNDTYTGGKDHAVIVTGYNRVTGVITYYDPTTKRPGSRPLIADSSGGGFSGFYTLETTSSGYEYSYGSNYYGSGYYPNY